MSDFKRIVIKSLLSTIYVATLTVLPFILGLMVNYFYPNDTIYYEKGEFFIYGISLLSSSILSYQNLGTIKDLTKGWLNNVSIVLIIIFSSVYAIIMTIQEISERETLRWTSIMIMCISLIVFYITQHIYNRNVWLTKKQHESLDIKEKRNQEQREIVDRLN